VNAFTFVGIARMILYISEFATGRGGIFFPPPALVPHSATMIFSYAPRCPYDCRQ
jgi:hypothetical protein